MLDHLHCTNLATSKAFQAEVALAAKYAGPGPRYTSYPTAAQFADNFAVQPYLDWVRHDSEQKHAPLSLYIHVPFCSNICYYCACNKIVTRDETAAREYLSRLMTEIERQSELVGSNRPITQMHWGGGSPTFLDNAEITELMHSLASHFRLLDEGYREYSIELDPRTVDKGTIALLKGLGFNRISLGVQDLDPLVQKAINRIQPLRQIESLTESIRKHNFRSLNFDLIYGLPYQDRDSIEETLRRVIELAPDRIACYNYAHLPERFSSQRAIERMALPKPGEKLLLQQIISHRLQEAGYQHIGMDHYVLPTDDLAVALAEGRLQRNFQGYSLQLAEDLLGLGVSAISQVGDYYLQNTRELNDYYSLIDCGRHPVTRGYRVTPEDKLRRHIIMSLISELQLDLAECEERFGTDFSGRFHRELGELHRMKEDGLLEIDRHRIRVTHSGRAFLRNICMTFDAYLDRQRRDPSAPNYSATI
jgi:oxygen-independent coproporphyrinogen-3 oxidase